LDLNPASSFLAMNLRPSLAAGMFVAAIARVGVIVGRDSRRNGRSFTAREHFRIAN
jgi:hypothetical protein